MKSRIAIRILLILLGMLIVTAAFVYKRTGSLSALVDFSHTYLTKTVMFEASGFVSSRTSASEIAPENASTTTPEVKLLFVGDMMFDRYIRKMSESRGDDYIFSCIDDELARADLVIGNLEGPITSYASVSKGTKIGSPDNYRFTFASTTAGLLARHHMKLVNLGNNHISNFGLSGIASTRAYLEQAGVAYFGGLRGNAPVYRTAISGIDLSFVNYNEFGGDTVDTVVKEISDERALGRTVIVYAHWGEEYVEPPERVRVAARKLAEAGASLIVGSHPHVVDMHEMIGDMPVYYSLGNFIFDQYWDESVSNGLMLSVRIGKDAVVSGTAGVAGSAGGVKITVDEKPVHLEKDGRVCP